MLLFSLDGATALAAGLAGQLDEPLALLEERAFLDGEHKTRPLVDPRGQDCQVVAALHSGPGLSTHDKLVRLPFLCATLRDHGAARVTAVLPYLAYTRKDHRTHAFDPVTTRVLAQLLEASGVQQLIALAPHNSTALDNAFRIPTRLVDVEALFCEAVLPLVGTRPVVVAAPHPEGAGRARRWREALHAKLGREVGFAFTDQPHSPAVVGGLEPLAGEVRGATVLLIDDLIASGETLVHAARTVRAHGAQSVIACAAHGLFVDRAATRLLDGAIDKLVVTDSVPTFRIPDDSPLKRRLQVVSAAPLLAEAVRRGRIG